MIIQQMIRKDPLYVDLHGYREEEVNDLMDAIARMINEQANMGNYENIQAMRRSR
jgi:hypothetical protein